MSLNFLFILLLESKSFLRAIRLIPVWEYSACLKLRDKRVLVSLVINFKRKESYVRIILPYHYYRDYVTSISLQHCLMFGVCGEQWDTGTDWVIGILWHRIAAETISICYDGSSSFTIGLKLWRLWKILTFNSTPFINMRWLIIMIMNTCSLFIRPEPKRPMV